MAVNEPSSQVLVAEDDRSVRESLVMALQVEGYDVEAVTNGAEALESVRGARTRRHRPRHHDAGPRRAHRVPAAARG